jgi:hypothetical protein
LAIFDLVFERLGRLGKSNIMRNLFLAACTAVSLAACVDTNTVRDATPTAGTERQFAGGYDAVAAATLDSVRSLNVSVTGPKNARSAS